MASVVKYPALLGRSTTDGRRPRLVGLVFLTLALCGPTAITGIAPARADEVTDWNASAIDVLALGGQNPIVMTRGLAMAHLAVHDALNAIDRRYEPYLYDAPLAAHSLSVPPAPLTADSLALQRPDASNHPPSQAIGNSPLSPCLVAMSGRHSDTVDTARRAAAG
jgi:hypothetical protein